MKMSMHKKITGIVKNWATNMKRLLYFNDFIDFNVIRQIIRD